MSDFLSDQSADVRTSHLSSNNPFRARAVSPSIPSPTSPFLDPAPPKTANGRPVSRNPFLDPSNDSTPSNGDLLISLDDMASRPAATGPSGSNIDDIFMSLKIDDKSMASIKNPTAAGPSSSGEAPQRPTDGRPPRPPGGPQGPPGSRPSRGGRGGPPPPRAKNVPPRQMPPPNHRPTQSQEEKAKPGIVKGEAVASSSGRRPSQTARPRRNSESSIAPDDKTLSRGEKVLRDLRKRDQEQRERGSTRPHRRNDIIDQMDASSIFGNVFHHDGPFDALNPHRNRKGSRRAPMQAFPKDSLNNSIGGSGPLNKRPDHRTFMGQGEDEAFREFSNNPMPPSSGKIGAGVFDPLQRGSALHGDQSLGLGTSTFLEGTPAARTTIQRREAERAQDIQDNPLQRKKSLAQRFRSINRGPREPHPTRAFSSDNGPASAGATTGRYNSEVNPFDEFDPKRGEDIITVRRKNSAALPSPSSPPRGLGLERRSTTDGTTAATSPRSDSVNPTTTVISSGVGDESQPKPTSLLARVKSLKGGRRPAPPPPPPIIKDS
ncbi:hypothetical protein SBRCBS47491_008949 [Sporothrix bragantina]|uniref:Pal1 cell morphology protein n=1 Tax=Sporothrix bragantina TaxID=671064 RepID=A0ABP0CQN7_9PEZI